MVDLARPQWTLPQFLDPTQELPDSGFPFKRAPRRHQHTIFELTKDRPSFGFLLGPGLGKTKLTFDTAAYAYLRGRINCLLVVAPDGVHREWMTQELPKDLIPQVQAKAHYWTTGQGKRARAALDEALGYWRGLLVISVSHGALTSGDAVQFLRKVLEKRACLLAIDESHKFKTPSAQRTTLMRNLAPKAAMRRLLSGSMMTKGYEDLFAQYVILDRRILRMTTHAAFKAAYCQEVGSEHHKGTKIVGYRNLDDLYAQIGPYTASAEREHCLDLPPRSSVAREVRMAPPQRRAYEELRDECVTVLDSGQEVTEAQAAVRLLRMRQILSGFVGTDDGRVHEFPDIPRFDAVADLVEDARHQVLIWCCHRLDVERCAKLLTARGQSHALYYGGIPKGKPRDAQIDKFRAGAKALILTPDAAASGWTFNEADTSLWVSHTFNYEHRYQATFRNYRDGQTHPTFNVDLVCPGSLDVRMLRVTAGRETLNRDLREATRLDGSTPLTSLQRRVFAHLLRGDLDIEAPLEELLEAEEPASSPTTPHVYPHAPV